MKLTPVKKKHVLPLLLRGMGYTGVYTLVDLVWHGSTHIWLIVWTAFVGYTMARLLMHVFFGHRRGGAWHLSWPLEMFEDGDA